MPRRVLFRGLSRLAAALVLLAGARPAAAAASFEMLPGAVVDPHRGVIAVMQPDSGIAVVDARTGRERCSTKHAARPLLLDGSRLLAQTESGGSTLRLYVLDLQWPSAASGCTLVPRRRVEVALPAHVVTAIDERIDSAFDARAVPDSGGAIVQWSFRESPAFPDSSAENGAFRVDLASGAVEPVVAVASVPGPPRRALSPVPGSVSRRVAVDDMLVSVAVQRETDGTRSVALARRSAASGASLGESLLDARDVRALRLSADDRDLLVSGMAAGAPPGERYVWSIYALDSGHKRGELRAGRSGQPFWVHDPVVIYRDEASVTRGAGAATFDRPVLLVARPLAGGAPVWTHAIRDTAYRGVRAPKMPHGNRRNLEIEGAAAASAGGGAR